MIKLQVNGREMNFTQAELIKILEEYYKKKEQKKPEIVQTPTEGKWFRVNPETINRKLFEEKRDDYKQEIVRQYILDTFKKMDENPKYCKPFKIMFPEKTWFVKTAGQLQELASTLGSHNADIFEQALEWAQRISNGETWEELCNQQDRANWYRLVKSKKDSFYIVGGCYNSKSNYSAARLSSSICLEDTKLDHVVPLIVTYED